MIQKKSPPPGDPKLWLQMRYLESAARSISDVDLALTDEMIARDTEAGNKGYATIMKGYPPPPWPCMPPSPCIKTLADLEEFIKLITRWQKRWCVGSGPSSWMPGSWGSTRSPSG